MLTANIVIEGFIEKSKTHKFNFILGKSYKNMSKHSMCTHARMIDESIALKVNLINVEIQ